MALGAEELGLLQALAQIAVAFAGFAGVIGAFSQFTTHPRVTAFRVKGMVAISLFALISSLAPIFAAALVSDVATIWRASAAVIAALGAGLFASLLREVTPLFQEQLLKTEAINIIWYGVSAASIVVLVCIAAGLVPMQKGADAYAASIVFMLVLCAYNFLMLILSVRFDGRP